MKLLVTLLTSSNIEKLKRLVDSFIISKENLTSTVFSEIKCVIVVNTLSDEYYQRVLLEKFDFPVVRTTSNGKPGKGKNSCIELFLNTDYDYLSQIDGDDILYPTYLESLSLHVKQFPGLDVLGIVPMDVICDDPNVLGYRFKVWDNAWAGVWGTSTVYPYAELPGPNRSYLWDMDLPHSADFIILQSRRSCDHHRFEEEMGVGEDHLYSIQLLSEHQKGNIGYFHTMSSDMFVIDRTTEGSIQKIFPQHEYVQALKDNIRKYVVESRSSIYELPLVYKELLLNNLEKEEWLTSFCSKYS